MKTKKALSILLTAAIILSLIPALTPTAHAATDPENFFHVGTTWQWQGRRNRYDIEDIHYAITAAAAWSRENENTQAYVLDGTGEYEIPFRTVEDGIYYTPPVYDERRIHHRGI
jgi:hypothetical protein